MSARNHGYHVGYELAKAHQAEMREARAQDRLAQQVRVTHPEKSARVAIYCGMTTPVRVLWSMVSRWTVRREGRVGLTPPRSIDK